MNAIAAGFGANVQDGIPNTRRLAKEDLISADQAKRESIHERIQGVSIVEGDFAADGRHSERVSIMSDPGDDTGEQRTIPLPILRIVQRSEAQTVQRRDRASAHRENVAQDSAHASGGALK